jgi:hypothetical protein
MKQPLRWIATLPLVVLACNESEPSDAPFLSGLPELRIAPEPSLIISDDGTPGRLFAGLSVRRLSTGEIVVADQGSAELRLFDAQGTFLRYLARRGQGPGELEGGVTIAVVRDTIAALPLLSSSRLVRFYTTDGFIAEWLPSDPASGGPVVVRGWLSSGAFLVQQGLRFRALNAAPEIGSAYPDSVTLGLLRHVPVPVGAAMPDEITWLPRMLRETLLAHEWPGGPIASALAPSPFGARTEVVTSGDQVWLLDPLTGSLRATSGMGKERATGPLPVARSRLAAAQVAALREAAMKDARRAMDSARVTAQYDPTTAPDEAPYFASAMAGWDDGLWARLFPGELGRECRHLILDANGKAASWACIPPDVRVEQVGWDFLLGVRTDSVGLESVVLFPIPR